MHTSVSSRLNACVCALYSVRLCPPCYSSDLRIANRFRNCNRNIQAKEPASKAEMAERPKDKGTIEKIPTLDLSSGYKMPVLSVGTALIPPADAGAVVKAAIDLGYRHIDTATLYGNERQIGRAIREKIDSGDVTRDELFITSKLWSTFHRADLALQACRDLLDTLSLQYLDLFLIHCPMSFKEGPHLLPYEDGVLQYSASGDYMQAWRGLEEAALAGLVRSIGVSNFNSEQLARVTEHARIQPAVNQVECHPYLAQVRLSEFCSKLGVKMAAYGTMGSAGTPSSFITLGRPILAERLVARLAEKYKKTAAHILIRYQLDRGHCAVVKTSSAARLRENLEAATFQLEMEDVRALDRLDSNERHFTFKGMGETHCNYPFKIDF